MAPPRSRKTKESALGHGNPSEILPEEELRTESESTESESSKSESSDSESSDSERGSESDLGSENENVGKLEGCDEGECEEEEEDEDGQNEMERGEEYDLGEEEYENGGNVNTQKTSSSRNIGKKTVCHANSSRATEKTGAQPPAGNPLGKGKNESGKSPVKNPSAPKAASSAKRGDPKQNEDSEWINFEDVLKNEECKALDVGVQSTVFHKECGSQNPMILLNTLQFCRNDIWRRSLDHFMLKFRQTLTLEKNIISNERVFMKTAKSFQCEIQAIRHYLSSGGQGSQTKPGNMWKSAVASKGKDKASSHSRGKNLGASEATEDISQREDHATIIKNALRTIREFTFTVFDFRKVLPTPEAVNIVSELSKEMIKISFQLSFALDIILSLWMAIGEIQQFMATGQTEETKVSKKASKPVTSGNRQVAPMGKNTEAFDKEKCMRTLTTGLNSITRGHTDRTKLIKASDRLDVAKRFEEFIRIEGKLIEGDAAYQLKTEQVRAHVDAIRLYLQARKGKINSTELLNRHDRMRNLIDCFDPEIREKNVKLFLTGLSDEPTYINELEEKYPDEAEVNKTVPKTKRTIK